MAAVRKAGNGVIKMRAMYVKAARSVALAPTNCKEGPPGAIRYGEADNPGPGDGRDELPLRMRPDEEDLAYPQAHRDGFRSIRAAGFGHLSKDGPKAGEQFSMIMETANTTGWRALKRRLCTTKAHLLFAQETRIRARDVPMASSWARRHGWKSLWSPAIRGRRGGPAAGVAVFAKDFLGLRAPPMGGQAIYDGRAVAGVVDAPGYRPFLAASV
jgi:hypothetical protein